MANKLIDSVNLGGSHVAESLSMWGMFIQADLIVKVVMLMLLAASIWCWAIIVDKVIKMRKLRVKTKGFEDSFWSGASLDDLYDQISNKPSDPMSAVFVSAMREWRRSAAKGLTKSESLKANLKQRIEWVMSVTLGREMERLEKHMIVLASVGSTAPFIGLFGTVWGIMNSFSSIAASKNTSLAVVAPGIAEALFATALGLVAAIPAVLAYNKLASEFGRYGQKLESFSGEFSAILSRRLDEGEAI